MVIFTKDALASMVERYKDEYGDHTYGRPTIMRSGRTRLRMGKYCSIAPGVTILLGGNHRVDWVTTYPFSAVPGWPEAAGIRGHPKTNGDVVIGHDVWLSRGCCILSGVTVGHGAVIGAEALVTRNVEPYAIIGGNPGRVIKKRFSEEIIAKLLEIAWWDWPEERIRRGLPHLLSERIEDFIAFAEQG